MSQFKYEAMKLAKYYTPVIDWNRANATARARLAEPIETALVAAFNAGLTAAIKATAEHDTLMHSNPASAGNALDYARSYFRELMLPVSS